MIYYPLSTLMLACIHEVLIITTPHDQSTFERLLGDGHLLRSAAQSGWSGQAFLIGAEFLDGAPAALHLGANLFHSHVLVPQLQASYGGGYGATVYAYPVRDAERYGVVVIGTLAVPQSSPGPVRLCDLNSKTNQATTT